MAQLIDLYVSFRNGDLSEDEFATGFGIDASSLRHRMTIWGPRLPLMLTTLDSISDGSMTRKKAAEVLNISPRAVNKLMESWQVVRPIGVSRTEREMTKVKRVVQLNAAIDYIAGRRDLAKSSDDAHLSDRQMRRWVARLLGDHAGMSWIEFHDGLKERDESERQDAQQWRQGIAAKIRRATAIEGAKEDLARRISAGKTSVKDVAISNRVERRYGAA